jgi:diguanylate cyclase (GGDEF)-like protein
MIQVPVVPLAVHRGTLLTLGVQRKHGVDLASARLRRALAGLADANRLLGRSRTQVEILTGNITHLRAKLASLAQQITRAHEFANYDELTGLPNRSLLLNRLKQATAQAARQNRQVTLLFVGVDELKGANGMFGRPTGDMLLQEVAQRIGICIRGSDTACRYGPNEFVIMLPGTDTLTGTTVAKKISKRLADPFIFDGKVIDITANVHVAAYPVDVRHYQQLIERADIDMYLDRAQRVPTET